MKIVWWSKEKEFYGEDTKQEDEKTLRLLQGLKTKWEIDFEIVRDFNDGDVYNKIFLKRRTILKKNSGLSVTALKSRSGNIFMDGTVCLFENNRPIFFRPFWERNKFLESLLKNGAGYVDLQIKENQNKLIKASPELQLVKDFLIKAKDLGFTGEFEENFPLKILTKEESDEFAKRFSYIAQKEIDILHKAPNGCFDVIEAKVKLNWAALGQAIGYAEVFSKTNSVPKDKISSYIICRQSDNLIEYVCKLFNIKVLIISRSKEDICLN